jgi:hypothetical protein
MWRAWPRVSEEEGRQEEGDDDGVEGEGDEGSTGTLPLAIEVPDDGGYSYGDGGGDEVADANAAVVGVEGEADQPRRATATTRWARPRVHRDTHGLLALCELPEAGSRAVTKVASPNRAIESQAEAGESVTVKLKPRRSEPTTSRGTFFSRASVDFGEGPLRFSSALLLVAAVRRHSYSMSRRRNVFGEYLPDRLTVSR